MLFYPNATNRPEVEAQIVKLKEAIASTEKAKNAPPTGTAEPKPLDDKATAGAAEPAHTAVAQPTPPRDQPTPIYKKWWLWTIIGGVVVVGAVVAVAVVLTQPGWSTLGDIGPGRSAVLVRW